MAPPRRPTVVHNRALEGRHPHSRAGSPHRRTSYPHRCPQTWTNDIRVVLQVRRWRRACRARGGAAAPWCPSPPSPAATFLDAIAIVAGQVDTFLAGCGGRVRARTASPQAAGVCDHRQRMRLLRRAAKLSPPSVHIGSRVIHSKILQSPSRPRVIPNLVHSWGKPHACSSSRRPRTGARGGIGPARFGAERARPARFRAARFRAARA